LHDRRADAALRELVTNMCLLTPPVRQKSIDAARGKS
jgi:hypothetical protein